MKIHGFITVYLLLALSYSYMGFAQTVPPAPSPTCVACGGKNGQHATSCRYYNPPAGKADSKNPYTSGPNQLQQLNLLIDLFNTPPDNAEVEAKQADARKKALETKQLEENMRSERHAREMKTFKPLEEDQNSTRSGTQPGSGLSMKPLPVNGAPMTMEERERQNILKQNVGVTWNYDEFSSVSADNRIIEPDPAPAITEEEKLVNDVIDEVESHGGRMAAITGRFILNVKDGVMSYLNDAAYAVTSGNTVIMQETGEFEVKKVITNALYKTATQTAEKYAENVMEAVKSEATGGGIGILKNVAINRAEKYRYFDDLSKAWKQVN